MPKAADPTPSPLLRMRDPLKYQILPLSRPALPPPPPEPETTDHRGKTIVTEEVYTAALEQIVERDFFPDVASARATAAAAADDVAGLGLRARQGVEVEEEDDGQAAAVAAAALTASASIEGRSLGGFQRRHTTEDAASFGKLLAADAASHRARFSWAFDDGSSKTLLLCDGTTMTADRRAVMDAACAPKARLGDGRKGRVDSWPYRARNGLSFYPQLEEQREAAGLPRTRGQGRGDGGQSGVLPLRLTEAGGGEGAGAAAAAAAQTAAGEGGGSAAGCGGRRVLSDKALAKLSRKRARADALAAAPNLLPPQHINHAATRMEESTTDALAPPRASSSSSLYSRAQQQQQQQQRAQQLRMVSMTPSPMPGAAGDSPLFTYGDIDGTPLLLDPSRTPAPRCPPGGGGGGDGGSMFHVAEQPAREQTAHRLEARQRCGGRGGGSVCGGVSGGGSSNRRRKNSCGGGRRRDGGSLTPAAAALARKLAGGDGASGSNTPFSSVRSSYSPLSQHPAATRGRGQRAATTPRFTKKNSLQKLQQQSMGSAKRERATTGSGNDGADDGRKGSITDGLLH